MKKIKHKSKLKYFFSFLIFTISLEVFLRLFASFTFTTQKQNLSHYRVLTLGESTTASISNNNMAWPEILAKMAADKNMKLSVFNEGVPATNTSRIIENLSQQLTAHQPHLIIAMMGINDTKNLWPKDLLLSDNNIILNLRVLKLMRLLYIQTKNFATDTMRPPAKPVVYASSLGLPYQNFIEALSKADIKSSDYQKTIEQIRTLVESRSKTEQAQFFARIAMALDESGTHRNEEMMLDLFFTIAELDANVIRSAELALMSALKTQNYSKCKEIVNFALRDQSEIRPEFLNYASICIGPTDAEFVHELLKHAGDRYVFRPNSNKSPVSQNYEILKKTALEKKICLLVLSYPNTQLYDFLKTGFADEAHGVYVLEQYDTFQKALKNMSFQELFEDNFAGNFGHATYQGNRLIADNVFEVLEKLKLQNVCGTESL